MLIIEILKFTKTKIIETQRSFNVREVLLSMEKKFKKKKCDLLFVENFQRKKHE